MFTNRLSAACGVVLAGWYVSYCARVYCLKKAEEKTLYFLIGDTPESSDWINKTREGQMWTSKTFVAPYGQLYVLRQKKKRLFSKVKVKAAYLKCQLVRITCKCIVKLSPHS